MAALFDAHSNFGYSTVATAPSPASSGTSLVVQSGDGSKFAVGQNCVVCPANTQPTTANAEIVRVTAISTDTLTITRTQEGTSARSIVVGDQVFNAPTSKALTDLEAYIILRAIAWIKEDFLGGGTSADTIGEMGWYQLNGTFSYLASVQDHPGIAHFATGASNGNQCNLVLRDNPSAKSLVTSNTIDMTFWLRIPTLTNCAVAFGLADDGTQLFPNNGIFLRADPSLANWQCQVSNGGAFGTETDMGVAVGANTWTRCRFVATSSSVTFYINDANATTISTGLPASTTAMNPYVCVQTSTTASRTLDLDAVLLVVTVNR